MANPPRTAVGTYLVWVFWQGIPFMSVVAGQPVIDGVVHFVRPPWPILALSALLFLWVAFALVRNLIRLWRAPASEARRPHFLPLLVVAAVFLWFGLGLLIEGRELTTTPLGLIWLVVGLNLLALWIREVFRLRVRRRATAGAQVG